MRIETDYLVVGAGATGLAFADSLVAEAKDVDVTVIERQQAPGGHWLDAYPFVRLHSPSAYYGVNSLALGEDRVDEVGENAGYLRTGDRRGDPRRTLRGGRRAHADRTGPLAHPPRASGQRE